MRDPGYISEAAWNQEHPYGDFLGYDLEQDQRHELVDPSGFFYDDSFLPTRLFAPGVVPAPTARRGNNPPVAAGLLPGGDQPS